jgi:transposase
MTISDLSKICGLHWHTIKQIEKQYLGTKYKHIPMKDVRYLAIDEFSVRKGHKYMTVVMNWESGQVLYVGLGRASEVLNDFWRKIKRWKSKIKAVAMDMWPAYIKSVRDHLPKAQIVYDWFHVVKMINHGIDQLRRQLYKDELTQQQRKVLKGSRWILLKRGYNLNTNRNEQQRLQEALIMNKPLATAYYLKEDLTQLWHCDNKKIAMKFLEDWCQRARASGITILAKLANTIARARTGLLAWFDHPISTGPLEGLNNKIKVLKRRAYGYRDLEYFKLKILDIHETRYPLLR